MVFLKVLWWCWWYFESVLRMFWEFFEGIWLSFESVLRVFEGVLYKFILGWARGIDVWLSFSLVEPPQVRFSKKFYPPPNVAQEEWHCLELWEVLGERGRPAGEAFLKQVPHQKDWSWHSGSSLAARKWWILLCRAISNSFRNLYCSRISSVTFVNWNLVIKSLEKEQSMMWFLWRLCGLEIHGWYCISAQLLTE